MGLKEQEWVFFQCPLLTADRIEEALVEATYFDDECARIVAEGRNHVG